MREECLNALYLIVHHLSNNPYKCEVVDPNTPKLEKDQFNLNAYWKGF